MNDSDLERKLSLLSLRDSAFERCLKAIEGNKIEDQSEKDRIEKELESIIEDQIKKQALLDLLFGHTRAFLKFLYDINDLNGSLLVKMLRDEPEEKVKQVLNALRLLLINHDSDKEVLFYLGLQIKVISATKILNMQHVPVLLSLLNPISYETPQLAEKAYSLVLINLIQVRSSDASGSNEELESFLWLQLDLSKEGHRPEFLNLCKILEALFPIFPDIIIKFFLGIEFTELLKKKVKDMSALVLRTDLDWITSLQILKLLDASCLDESCRFFVHENFFDIILACVNLNGDTLLEHQLVATLCTTKLWNIIQMEKDKYKKERINAIRLVEISSKSLIDAFPKKRIIIIALSIECLAYLSSLISIRGAIRNDETLLEYLLKVIKLCGNDKEDLLNAGFSLTYGILSIFANLTDLNYIIEDSKGDRNQFIRGISSQQANVKSTKNEMTEIENFCKHLVLNSDIIRMVSNLRHTNKAGNSKDESLPANSVNLIFKIFYSMSFAQDKTVRQKLVQDGVFTKSFDYLLKTSRIIKNPDAMTIPINDDDDIVQTRLYAIRVILRILISVNPKSVLDDRDSLAILPFIFELFAKDSMSNSTLSAEASSQEVGVLYLDTFEALMALTNLSGAELSKSSEVKKIIAEKAFDRYVDGFLHHSNPNIRRAAWELVCNLFFETNILAKFLNISKSGNLERLKFLVQMMDSTDPGLQTTIASILANGMSEFDYMTEILINNTDIFHNLIQIISSILNSDSSDDLILRILYILLSILYMLKENNLFERSAEISANSKLKSGIQNAMRNTSSQENKGLLYECIKLGTFT